MSFQIHVPDHILFEDPFILVTWKPHGLMVEPDRNGHPNLLQQVQKYLRASAAPGQEVYVQHIHRLDRPVSGIVLFAKQRAVLKNLSEQFAERKVKKHYRALTVSKPAHMSGTLEHWHRKEKKKAVIVDEHTPWAEKIRLDYEVFPQAEKKFLWQIELHTGKFHQIRLQLASTGCPILGDQLYGSETSYEPEAIALQAGRLIFAHPVSGETMTIEQWTEPFRVGSAT